MPRLAFRRSIRGRILLGFLAMSLIAGAIGGFGLWAVTKAGGIVADTYARPLMAINFARAASVGFALMDRERLYLELKPSMDVAGVHATVDRLAKTFFEDLAVAEQRALSADARAAARAVREAAQSWTARFDALDPNAPPAAHDELKALAAAVLERLETLIELTAGDSFMERQRAVDAIAETQWLVAATLGVALALSALVTLYLGRRIVRPLTEAGRVADRIAAGEFHTPIPEAGPDETGVLLRSMQVLQDSIREMMLREQARSWSAQARLISALESSPDGLALLDSQGRLVIANNQVASFFPDARDALVEGTPFERLFALVAPHHGVDPIGRRADAEALTHRPARLADGRWLRLSRAMTSEGGAFLLWTDITELKLREARIEAARHEAEAASRAKSAFLAAMGHELRTPLNAVIGFSEMIGGQMLGPVGNDTYREYADSITDSGRHLLEIINNVLELAKSEGGNVDLDTGPLDLGELVEDLSARAGEQCKQAKLAFTLGNLPRSIMVQGDLGKLRQVVHALLSNAVKFTRAGGAVRLDMQVNLAEAVIAVTDTGIGMSAEQIPVALSPFGQVDSRLARSYDGAGLGLPIAKAFVEAHGGRLEIESRLGEGTTVRVRLPRLMQAPKLSAAAE